MTTKQEKENRNTKSWNPFVGCRFDCVYCKPSFGDLIAWLGRMHHCRDCQIYRPHEHPERLRKLYGDKAIFVCEDGDIAFARPAFMREILHVLRSDRKPNRIWFLQSKDPRCFQQYLSLLPSNAYIVTTLETNRDNGYRDISKAPLPSQRYNDFMDLRWDKKIVTVEPVLDFDLEVLEQWIVSINPRAVFIGYNSKPKEVSIPEPERKKTWQLIHDLEDRGIRVFKKEMRDKRVHKKAYKDFAEKWKAMSLED